MMWFLVGALFVIFVVLWASLIVASRADEAARRFMDERETLDD